ncbi:hypothetical protein B0H13DRAFT_1098401 [Mycena leptocephala]|nr:hypothetical protein B0H13DRAFT_1098401 [Mycena leptocephala]
MGFSLGQLRGGLRHLSLKIKILPTGHSHIELKTGCSGPTIQKPVYKYLFINIFTNQHKKQRSKVRDRIPEPHTTSFSIWDLFSPAFSCPFPVYRVGTMGDGGKYVCGLERATQHSNCVVYSKGVETKSSFEQEKQIGCRDKNLPKMGSW